VGTGSKSQSGGCSSRSIELGLPITKSSRRSERCLAFDFLADTGSNGPHVLTGHTGGVITVNIAEADDAERERRRSAMGEPYRTLLRTHAARERPLLLESLIGATQTSINSDRVRGRARDYAFSLRLLL